jgi:hypothetical protein
MIVFGFRSDHLSSLVVAGFEEDTDEVLGICRKHFNKPGEKSLEPG